MLTESDFNQQRPPLTEGGLPVLHLTIKRTRAGIT